MTHRLGPSTRLIWVFSGLWGLWLVASRGCLRESVIASVQSECGDGRCDEGEAPLSCAQDCALNECGNHLCEFGEDEASCPGDCSGMECGDFVCQGPETPVSCPSDCAWGLCGNNVCEPGEADGGCNLDCWPLHCGNGICDSVETVADCPEDCLPTSAVDILLVVDDSESMAPYQERLSRALPSMYEDLVRRLGDRLDIHVGVVTTDLGADGYDSIAGCNDHGGDQGIIGRVGGLDMAARCLDSGERYLVDLAPRDCDILRYADGRCGQNDCDETNCAFEPGSSLVRDDATGCPRCRNFQGQAADAFSCLVSLGSGGCGFEQPLEAMRLALDGNPANRGFLRSDSLLVVLFLSDEDDCSAADAGDLFDPDPAVESQLGPLTSYRCTRYGVQCNESMEEPGHKSDCGPVQGGRLLEDPRDSVEFLSRLHGPGRLVAARVTGPFDGSLSVVEGSMPGRLTLGFSCTLGSRDQGAQPAVRLAWFTRQFRSPGGDFLEESICSDNYGALAAALAREIARRIEPE